MQGLADSLVNLPIWNVLDLEAALCQSFLPSATQEAAPETSNHPLDQSTGNADLAKTNTSAHSKPQNASGLGSAAVSRTTPAQTEATATSSDAHALKGHAAITPAVQNQGFPSAAAVQQTFVDHKGGHDPSEDDDALDLDDLLNTASSIPQPASTATAKAGPQDQDNLEDWLNSL